MCPEICEKLFKITVKFKNEANFVREKIKRHISNSSYRQIGKKTFGGEHCFKTVDWLKREYNKRVIDFSKKSDYYFFAKLALDEGTDRKIWMAELQRPYVCGISNHVK